MQMLDRLETLSGYYRPRRIQAQIRLILSSPPYLNVVVLIAALP
jgi:hypothetical protein